LTELDIEVETQSFRFTPRKPISLEDAVSIGGASSNGAFAVIDHENPRSVIIIEPSGSLLVHGIANVEAASLIASEIILKLGMDDSGLSVEKGDVLATFSIGKAVLLGLAAERFSDIEYDERLDAIRIDAKRYKCKILLFNNGRGIVMGQNSTKISGMAATYWVAALEKEGALA